MISVVDYLREFHFLSPSLALSLSLPVNPPPPDSPFRLFTQSFWVKAEHMFSAQSFNIEENQFLVQKKSIIKKKRSDNSKKFVTLEHVQLYRPMHKRNERNFLRGAKQDYPQPFISI